jgi:hypothetical protein
MFFDDVSKSASNTVVLILLYKEVTEVALAAIPIVPTVPAAVRNVLLFILFCFKVIYLTFGFSNGYPI